MKILIVIDSIGTGGAQKLKAELARGFSNAGNMVEIFTYNNSSDDYFKNVLIEEGVKIHVAKKNKNGFSYSVLSTLRKLISNDFDVVIAQCIHQAYIHFYPCLVKEILNLLFVKKVHR